MKIGLRTVDDASEFSIYSSSQTSQTISLLNTVTYNLSIPYSEYSALEALYESTVGSSWIWILGQGGIPWDFSGQSDPCIDQWQGILCECNSTLSTVSSANYFLSSNMSGNTSCTIVEFQLPAHNITGPLPPEIANLTNMRSMIFERNHVTNPLPNTLPLMSKLTRLDLAINRLWEIFPSWLCTLPAIETFDFHDNFLRGTLPAECYNMSTLISFDVSSNFLDGTISDAIRNLTSLQSLQLGENTFNGTLPETIQYMTNLTLLDFSLTAFNGGFPSWIYNMTWLTGLSFGYNDYNGTFPAEIGNLKELKELDFDSNQFSGPFPDVLFSLTQLEQLDMSFNLFTSTIPDSIAILQHLKYFYAAGNLFDGQFPCASLAQMANMSILNIRNLLLNGTLDGCFGATSNITEVSMENNMLSGKLPQPLWRSLVTFIAYNNSFTGPLPGVSADDSLALRYYSVARNYVTGTLPAGLFILPDINYLLIAENFLNGTIDLQPTYRSSLAQIFLDRNLLTGTIPAVLANYSNMVEISISSNYLTGTVPVALNNLSFLAVLLIADNKLTGNLYNLFDPSQQSLVADVDVSRNSFTGTIPTNIFRMPHISAFAAFSNCLHGTLPDDICQAAELTALVLDGVSTARRCRHRIFPGSSVFKAFTLDRSLEGTIPACILSLPFLHTLQLSGNHLTGSIQQSITISSQLRDLTLSHNRLSGSVPPAFQSEYFPILDLSFNRFSGTLSSDFVSLSDRSTLYLRNNRLSGNIPAAFKSKLHINVLQGNIFECDASRSSLPENDPSRSVYVCGSDELNDSLFAWCAAAGIVVMILIWGMWICFFRNKALHVTGGTVLSSAYGLFVDAVSLPSYINSSSLGNQHQPIFILFDFFAYLRTVFLIFGLALVLVLMPTYSSLTHSSHTYENQYGWSVSGVFLQGMKPAAIMIYVLGAFLLFLVAAVKRYFVAGKLPSYWDHKGGNVTTAQWSMYGLVMGLNLTVMAAVDSTYIYIFLNYNATFVVLMQIAMAVLKVVWNEFVLWKLVAYCQVYLEMGKAEGNVGFPIYWHLMSMYEYTIQDVWLVLVTTLLNNTVVPSVAIAFISANCFYNAIIAAPEVSDYYYIFRCTYYLVADSLSQPICAEKRPIRQDISYDVPFRYSYQCASTIYVNYIPVYVFMFIGVGLMLPLFKWCIHEFYHRWLRPVESGNSESPWSKRVRSILPHLYTAPHTSHIDAGNDVVMLPILIIKPNDADSSSLGRQQAENNNPESLTRMSLPADFQRTSHLSLCDIPMEGVRRSMHRQDRQIGEKVTAYSLKGNAAGGVTTTSNNARSKSTSSSLSLNYCPPKLIQREKVVAQIVNYFAILLCFGTVYPPLAAIACVSFAVQSWASQYLVVSLLSRCWAVQQRGAGGAGGSQQDVVGFYAELLARQCRDVVSLFGSLVLYVLPFFFLLVGYLVFDTAGYTGGWREGLWCWVLFAAWPIAVAIFVRFVIHAIISKPGNDAVDISIEIRVTSTSPMALNVSAVESQLKNNDKTDSNSIMSESKASDYKNN
eukprot:gene24716-29867_t